MNARDEFLKQELARLLEPGERVLHTATVFSGPLLLSSLFGPVGQLLMLTHYFGVLTDRRLLLIRSGMGFAGLKCQNRGVIDFPIDQLDRVEGGGLFNQRSLALYRKDGTSMTIRYNTLVRQVAGQKEFAAAMPQRLQEMLKCRAAS
jgi:hypothetical protein